MERDPHIDAIAASDLSSAATLVALIGAVGAKGVLSDDEGREIYEQAQYLLETHQGDEPEARPIYHAAREIIEAQLLGAGLRGVAAAKNPPVEPEQAYHRQLSIPVG